MSALFDWVLVVAAAVIFLGVTVEQEARERRERARPPPFELPLRAANPWLQILAFLAGVLLLVLALSGVAVAQVSASPASEPSWLVAALPIAWAILTGIINTISHYATPSDVDAWAEANPRLARLLSMVRRAGFEPVALIQDAYGFFAGWPPPLGHGTAIGKPEARYQRVITPGTRGFSSLALFGWTSVVGVGVFLAFLLSGCAQGVTPSSAWQKLVADVKAGLAARDTEAQLEGIVVGDLGQDLSPQAAIILDGVLVVIEDGAAIAQVVGSPGPQTYEADIRAQVQAKILASRTNRAP